MFKITPSDAMTELYETGKGEAQVFDTRIAQDVLRQNKASQEQKAAAKQKAADDRDADIQKQLMQMSSVKVMPRDQELLAQKGNGVREYVVKNIDKLRKGDAQAMMGFQQLYGDYKTSADLSQNVREQWEGLGTEINKNGRDAYDQDVIDNYFNFAHPDNAGNMVLDKSQFSKRVDYMDRVIKDLSPYAERQAKQTGRVKEYSIDEAKQLIKDDISNDRAYMNQAVKDYSKASKEELEALGNPAGATEYYQAKYAPKLVAYNVTPTPQSSQSSGPGNSATEIGISGVLSKDGDGRDVLSFDTDKPVDNPYNVYVHNGKTIEGKPLKIIYNKDNKTAPELVVAVKPNKEQGIKGGEVTLSWTEAEKTLSNKYGLENPYDVLHGNEPKNWRINRPSQGENKSSQPAKKTEGKISQSDWNAKWSSLKAGQSMVGLDGKTYIKK